MGSRQRALQPAPLPWIARSPGTLSVPHAPLVWQRGLADAGDGTISRRRSSALAALVWSCELAAAVAVVAGATLALLHAPCVATTVSGSVVGATWLLAGGLHLASAAGFSRRSVGSGSVAVAAAMQYSRAWRPLLALPAFVALWSAGVTRHAPADFVSPRLWTSGLLMGCAWAVVCGTCPVHVCFRRGHGAVCTGQ
jgi:hypothetical protein